MPEDEVENCFQIFQLHHQELLHNQHVGGGSGKPGNRKLGLRVLQKQRTFDNSFLCHPRPQQEEDEISYYPQPTVLPTLISCDDETDELAPTIEAR